MERQDEDEAGLPVGAGFSRTLTLEGHIKHAVSSSISPVHIGVLVTLVTPLVLWLPIQEVFLCPYPTEMARPWVSIIYRASWSDDLSSRVGDQRHCDRQHLNISTISHACTTLPPSQAPPEPCS